MRSKIVKLIISLAICAAAVAFLQSRMKVGSMAQKSAKDINIVEQKEAFPDYYEKDVSSQFTIDAEIVVADGVEIDQIYTGTAKIDKIDQQKVIDYFGIDTEHTEVIEETGVSERSMEEYVEQYYTCPDGSLLNISPYELNYGKYPEMSYIYNSFKTNTREKYSKDRDLEFLSRQKAYEILVQELKK